MDSIGLALPSIVQHGQERPCDSGSIERCHDEDWNVEIRSEDQQGNQSARVELRHNSQEAGDFALMLMS